MSTNIQRLHETIAQAFPSLEGISVDIKNAAHIVEVMPKELQSQAQSIIDAFDWSDTAQAMWQRGQDRASAKQFLADNGPMALALRALVQAHGDELAAANIGFLTPSQSALAARAVTLLDAGTVEK